MSKVLKRKVWENHNNSKPRNFSHFISDYLIKNSQMSVLRAKDPKCETSRSIKAVMNLGTDTKIKRNYNCLHLKKETALQIISLDFDYISPQAHRMFWL